MLQNTLGGNISISLGTGQSMDFEQTHKIHQ